MAKLSEKQEDVRQFITGKLAAGRPCPSHREIAKHFRFKSVYAAQCHVNALITKGVFVTEPGNARSLRLPDNGQRPKLIEIPFFGTIPAGFGDDREQEPDGCMMVDIKTIDFKHTRNTFALKVVGDSMIGRHICDGDIAILEHGREPRHGQIVAALIDRKSTLKTFVQKGGKRYLRAENPKYPDLIPSEELMIQGVFCGLIRKA